MVQDGTDRIASIILLEYEEAMIPVIFLDSVDEIGSPFKEVSIHSFQRLCAPEFVIGFVLQPELQGVVR